MSGRTLLLTSAVALSLVAAPAAAQDPAGKAPASAPRADPATAASGPDFPAGAEVPAYVARLDPATACALGALLCAAVRPAGSD